MCSVQYSKHALQCTPGLNGDVIPRPSYIYADVGLNGDVIPRQAPGPPRDKSEWRRQNTVVQKHRLLTDLTVEQQLRLKRKTSGRRPNGIDGAGGAGDAGAGGERLPYLYWVTVLRNPVDRVFSEFFFLRPV